MDLILQPPSMPLEQRYLENSIEEIAAQMRPDIYLDKQKWNGSPPFDDAIQNMLIQFIEDQRVALYEKHAVGKWRADSCRTIDSGVY